MSNKSNKLFPLLLTLGVLGAGAGYLTSGANAFNQPESKQLNAQETKVAVNNTATELLASVKGVSASTAQEELQQLHEQTQNLLFAAGDSEESASVMDSQALALLKEADVKLTALVQAGIQKQIDVDQKDLSASCKASYTKEVQLTAAYNIQQAKSTTSPGFKAVQKELADNSASAVHQTCVKEAQALFKKLHASEFKAQSEADSAHKVEDAKNKAAYEQMTPQQKAQMEG